jgi:hypothetical protein
MVRTQTSQELIRFQRKEQRKEPIRIRPVASALMHGSNIKIAGTNTVRLKKRTKKRTRIVRVKNGSTAEFGGTRIVV